MMDGLRLMIGDTELATEGVVIQGHRQQVVA